jgi:hypothetical protein
LNLLSASVWLFAAAAGSVAASFLLRVTIGRHSPDDYPPWLPPVQVALAAWWFVLACGGCVCRVRGYLLCRPAAARYDLGPWAVAAAVGAGLASVGVLVVVPLVIGRPVLDLPPAGAGFLLVGMSAGLIGVLLEFAFMPVLNRVLWETAGWQAAAHTGRYAVAYVFAAVAVTAVLCLGVMALVLTADGREANAAEAGVPVQAKVIAVAVIAAVAVIVGWITWRQLKLLRVARRAVNTAEPQVASVK